MKRFLSLDHYAGNPQVLAPRYPFRELLHDARQSRNPGSKDEGIFEKRKGIENATKVSLDFIGSPDTAIGQHSLGPEPKQQRKWIRHAKDTRREDPVYRPGSRKRVSNH